MNPAVAFSARHQHLAAGFQSAGRVQVCGWPGQHITSDFLAFPPGVRPIRVWWVGESDMLDPVSAARLRERVFAAQPPPPAGAVAPQALCVVFLTRVPVTQKAFEEMQADLSSTALCDMPPPPPPRVVPVGGITDVFEELRRLAKPSGKAGGGAAARASGVHTGTELDRRWLAALQEIDGLGPAGLRRLTARWGSTEEVARASPAELQRVMGE